MAQVVKRWSANLAVPSSIPGGGSLFNRKQGFIAHSLPLPLFYLLDMTALLLKGRKIPSHPSINRLYLEMFLQPVLEQIATKNLKVILVPRL